MGAQSTQEGKPKVRKGWQGRGRQVGERNKAMKARMTQYRQLVALGLSDEEIKARIEEGNLTAKQWFRLKQNILADSRGESNLTFWARFLERHDLRYREAMRLLGFVHGVDNPQRRLDGKGRPIDPTDAFIVKPNVDQTVKVLRLLKELDEGKLEVGLRLNVFQREATKVLVGRLPAELDDQELGLALEEAVREAAVALALPEHEVRALLERGAGAVVEAEVVEVEEDGEHGANGSNGSNGTHGSGHGGNGTHGGNGAGGNGAPT